jgi:hypothetical protein
MSDPLSRLAMAIAYEEQSRMANFHRKLVYPNIGIV